MSNDSMNVLKPMSPAALALLEKRQRISLVDAETTSKEKLMTIGCAAALGILFDVFFNGQRFGISVILFAALTAGAVQLSTRSYRQPLLSTFLLASTLALSLTYAIFNNEALRILNALAIPLGMTAYVLTSRYGDWGDLGHSSMGLVIRKLVSQSIGTAPKLFTFTAKTFAGRKSGSFSETHGQIIKGLIIAAPLLALVLMLLTSSDAVFNHMVDNRFLFLENLRLERVINHTLLMGLTSLYFFGYLWSLKYESSSTDSAPPVSKNLSPVSAITVMGLLCAVYLLFTGVQFTYLYSPGASLPEGLTYAMYARRGFFELVAAAFVNMAIILIIASKTRDSVSKLSQSLLVCHSLLTVFTLNLLVSAFYRMHLYETAYGFTELRLFVQFFMAFMAISLAALLAWIWKRRFPFFKTVLVTAITVYVALNYVNVDRLIAHNNLVQWQTTRQIDLYHLSGMSVDAWPEIKTAALPIGMKNQLIHDFRMNTPANAEDQDRWYEYNVQLSHYFKSGGLK